MTNELKVDVYKVMQECVERGVSTGWRKAHKHDGKPDEDYLKDNIENAIMLEICEYFKFDNNG